MTDKERDDMYQDWTDLLYQYLKGDGDEERQYALEELLLAIGSRVGVDVSQLVDKLNAYYTEACKPEYTLKIGDICRVIEARTDGKFIYLWEGDIVKILNVQNSLCFVQSLMPTRTGDGCWRIKSSSLEEV